MNADKSVGANFTDPTPDTSVLHVWIDGWGSGTITSSPAGINCLVVRRLQCRLCHRLDGHAHRDPAEGSQFNGFLDCSRLGEPVHGARGPEPDLWSAFCPIDDLCSAR